jgi:hypothetical protein
VRTAIRDADYPAWAGCLCCGRVDAEGYVPVAQNQFLCYRCLDKLQETRRRNARAIRRLARRSRVLGWRPWPRKRCR